MNIFINNKINNNINNLKSKEIKTENYVNKIFLENKNKSKNKINKYNETNPVYNDSIKNNENYKNKQIKKNKNHQINTKDIYNNNKDISCMKKIPPQLPSLFGHNYTLENILVVIRRMEN